MNDLLRRLLMLPQQASSLARAIDTLHFVVIGTTMLGALAVSMAMLIYVLRSRRRAGCRGSAHVGERRVKAPKTPVGVEVTIFAGLMTLFTAFWIVGFGQFVELRSVPASAWPVYVTGKQWMWNFAYPNGTGSQAVLYVPAGRPVKLVMTSRDVIHSFYVPAFRLKQDVIPGRMTVAWFEAARPGSHEVLCAEYCGLSHSRMRARVVVLSDAALQRQLQRLGGMPDAEERADPELASDLVAQGERAARAHGCLACHRLDGQAAIGPPLAGLYDAEVPLASGQHVVADEAFLSAAMMDPSATVHAGYKPVMPSYQGVLSASETGALVELIRALRTPRPPDAPRPRLPSGPFADNTAEVTP